MTFALDLFNIAALIVFLLVVTVLVFGALIPREIIRWWLRFETDSHELEEALARARRLPDPTPGWNPGHYLIYLSGVADISGEVESPNETEFIERLRRELANTYAINDIYPYSLANRSPSEKGLMAWYWRAMEKRRQTGNMGRAAVLVQLHNVLRVATSADPRYGPIFNLGTAREMLFGLLRHGYRLGSGTPVTLIGSSGGGQIGLGAAGYLVQMLDAPVLMISLAGVFSSMPSLARVEHLHHIEGTRDFVPALSPILFPSRTAFAFNSYYNRARGEGKVTIHVVGPMTHTDANSYLDAHAHLKSGQSYQDKTVDTVIGILVTEGLDRRASPPKPVEASQPAGQVRA